MLKKSLTISGIGLLLVMLIALAGCEGPVGPAGASGSDGLDGKDAAQDPGDGDGDTTLPPGPPGSVNLGAGVVTKAALAKAFEESNVVVLNPGVQSVEGIVPSGCTLFVIGSGIPVGTGNLKIEGTLNIWKDGSLIADGVGTANRGKLISTGTIEGEGGIDLPIFLDKIPDDPAPEYLHYDSQELDDTGVGIYVGSIVGPSGPAALVAADIATIFARTLEPKIDSLTIRDMAFAAEGVPARKTLTLEGENNTITGAFAIGASQGRLIIAEDAKLTVSGSGAGITIPAGGGLINEGTIDLAATGNRITLSPGGYGVNNGIIKSRVTTVPLLNNISSFLGEGSVEQYTSISNIAASIQLNQNLVLKDNNSLTFALTTTPKAPFNVALGKKVTIETGTITFGTGSDVDYGLLPEFEIAGDPGSSGFSIVTDTVVHADLQALMNKVTLKGVEVGKIKSTGKIDVTSTSGLTDDFVVPAEVELTMDTAGSTFVNISGDTTGKYDLIVHGTLIFANACAGLAPTGDVIINGGLVLTNASSILTVDDGQALEIADLTKFTGGGKIARSVNNAKVKIDGKDYTLEGSAYALVGTDSATTAAAIKSVEDAFNDGIDLDTGFFTSIIVSGSVPKVSGTVDFVTTGSGSATSIKESGNPSGPGAHNLSVVSGVTVAANPAASESVAGTLTAGNFSFNTSLQALDRGYNSGTGSDNTFGVIKFANAVFTVTNKLSWVDADGFHIGIRTKR
jgi:hypothetical protein